MVDRTELCLKMATTDLSAADMERLLEAIDLGEPNDGPHVGTGPEDQPIASWDTAPARATLDVTTRLTAYLQARGLDRPFVTWEATSLEGLGILVRHQEQGPDRIFACDDHGNLLVSECAIATVLESGVTNAKEALTAILNLFDMPAPESLN